MSERRIQLEQAATVAVQRVGLSNLSFRTLADEVGIKSSSVHYHFPEKSHLAGAIIARYQTDFAAKLETIRAADTTLETKLLKLVGIFDQVLTERRFCLCGMLAAEVDTLSAENSAALKRFFAHLEQWLSEVITAHLEQNAPENAKQSTTQQLLTPGTLAQVIVSGLEGALLLDRLSGDKQNLAAQKQLIVHLIKGVDRA